MPVRNPRGARGMKAKNKADEEARLAEEAKRKEEERLEEEARLAAIAAEKTKADAIIKEKLSTTEGRAEDFQKWLSTIPLSRKNITRIERDFSDGGCILPKQSFLKSLMFYGLITVLVAEIIAHYCPDICHKNQYFTWYSSINKLSNWQMLNWKVFPELGFSLTDAQIGNLIKPWGGSKFSPTFFNEPYIYKLLDKIRDGIEPLNPAIYEYRQPDYEAPKEEEEASEPKPKPRTPRVDLDVAYPYSKIELQIARGLFDCSDKNKNKDVDTTCPSSNLNLYDWVKLNGCGCGGLFDKDKDCPKTA